MTSNSTAQAKQTKQPQVQPQQASRAKAQQSKSTQKQFFKGRIKIDDGTYLLIVRKDNLAMAARQALRALVTTGRYYLMGGELVEVAVHGDSRSAYMSTVTHEDLAAALGVILVAVEIDIGSMVVQKQVCADTLASHIELNRPFEELPVLAGVINGPAYRKDGSLITKPGYDKDSGLYLLNPKAKPAEFEYGATGDDDLDELLMSLV